jgi:hypothetical protein
MSRHLKEVHTDKLQTIENLPFFALHLAGLKHNTFFSVPKHVQCNALYLYLYHSQVRLKYILFEKM